MAYKGRSRHIRDALVTILQGLTYDAGGGAEAAFGLVTANPAADFTAEPFALVFPGPIDDAIITNASNDRTVNFSVFVLLKMETGTRTQAQTYDYMSDLTDTAMDALDEADFHDTLNTTDPAVGTYLMKTTRGQFVPAEAKSGAILLCTIDVAVSYSKDL